MKRHGILIVFILLALGLQAQDSSIINLVRNAGTAVPSFETTVKNIHIKKGKTTEQDGSLYFVAPYKFAVIFNTGKYMIVNEKKAKTNMGIFGGTYRLRDGGMIQSISHIFLYGFQGRCQDLANENDYSLTVKSDSNFHTIIGTPNKKSFLGLGYKQVIFKYSTKDLLIQEITLIDYNDTVDTYTITGTINQVPVDNSRFEF